MKYKKNNKNKRPEQAAERVMCWLIIFSALASSLLFLLVPISYSDEIIATPEPLFITIFSEPAYSIYSILVNQTGNELRLINVSVEQNMTKYVQAPVRELSNGSYFYSITGFDFLGNPGDTKSKNFRVEIGPPRFYLLYPRLGVSPTEEFDILIQVDRNATCRYNFNTFLSYDSMFLVMTARGNNTQSIDRSRFQGRLYVACKDKYNYTSDTIQFNISVDTSPPQITSAFADPSEVVQEINSTLSTTLFVTTNEPAVCRYSESANTFSAMTSGFDNENYSIIDTFVTSHQARLTGLLNRRTYSYNVRCQNPAGLDSQLASISFIVDTSRSLSVRILSPADRSVFNISTVLLNITTSKIVDSCIYGTDENSLNNFLGSGSNQFSTNIGLSNEGNFSIAVRCSFQGESDTAKSNFVIDRSSPRMTFVRTFASEGNRNLTTCSQSQLYGEWSAVDDLSGIARYEYAVFDRSSDTPLINFTGTDQNRRSLFNLNLTEFKSYEFRVQAFDKAGFRSEIMSSEAAVLVDKSACAPSCSNNVRDNDEADIDCGGNCPFKCAENQSCTRKADCSGSLQCSSGRCDYPKCENKRLDDSESDVDCGGSCNPCDEDKSCNDDSDCKSGLCHNDFCKTPSCSDSLKDGSETDIDCGGSCEGCEGNQSCVQDNDCESSNCINNICSASVCDDAIQNGQESDVDCGGSCGPCPDGKSCFANADCTSGKCSSQICEQDKNKDSDNDGLPDWWELQYGFNPQDPSDAGLDIDKDGLTNLQEFVNRTDPKNPDTDGDSYSDGTEVKEGSNPLDPNSVPKNKASYLLFLIPLLLLVLMLILLLYLRKKKKQEKRNQPSSLSSKFSQPSYISQQANQQKPGQVQQKTVPEQRRDLMQRQLFKQRTKAKYQHMSELFNQFSPESQDIEKIQIRSKNAQNAQAAVSQVGQKQSNQNQSNQNQSDESQEWLEINQLRKQNKQKNQENTHGNQLFDRLKELAELAISSKKRGQHGTDAEIFHGDTKSGALHKENLKEKSGLKGKDIFKELSEFSKTLHGQSDVKYSDGKEKQDEKQQEKKDAIAELSKLVAARLDKEINVIPNKEARYKTGKIELGKNGKKITEKSKGTKQEFSRAKISPKISKQQFKTTQEQRRKQLVLTLERLSKIHERTEVADVFREVLGYLIQTNRISKKDIAFVLFDLQAKGVLSDTQISDVMFKLGVKHSGKNSEKKYFKEYSGK